jgi:hypothetical protein
MLAPSSATLALTVGPAIEDEVAAGSLQVIGLRGALLRGFRAAFGDYFRVVEADSSPDLLLTILEATPMFVPTSVARGRIMAAAQIRYRIVLTRKAGGMEPLAGTAASKGSIMTDSPGSDIVASAIESLYETVADRFFSGRPSCAR